MSKRISFPYTSKLNPIFNFFALHFKGIKHVSQRPQTVQDEEMFKRV